MRPTLAQGSALTYNRFTPLCARLPSKPSPIPQDSTAIWTINQRLWVWAALKKQRIHAERVFMGKNTVNLFSFLPSLLPPVAPSSVFTSAGAGVNQRHTHFPISHLTCSMLVTVQLKCKVNTVSRPTWPVSPPTRST